MSNRILDKIIEGNVTLTTYIIQFNHNTYDLRVYSDTAGGVIDYCVSNNGVDIDDSSTLYALLQMVDKFEIKD
jgi:hypothetical protein